MKDRKTGIDPVEVIKVADPVVQVLLLISFLLSVDISVKSARYLFFDLLIYQFLSVAVNFVLKFPRKRFAERIAFALALAGYCYTYYYVKSSLHEEYFTSIDMQVWGKNGKNDFYLLLAGMGVSIWYITICLREARSMFRKRMRRKS